MQNIGILLESKIDITNIDIIKNGNPGIGGSEYLLLQLFYYLLGDGEYNCRLYTKGAIVHNKYASSVDSDLTALKKAIEDKIDIFIFIPKNKDNDFYKFIIAYKVYVCK